MPIFDVALMITGAILMVIGILLLMLNKKSGSAASKIEGFGIKLDIANPPLLLVFAGIGMMLVPRFIPSPVTGPVEVSILDAEDSMSAMAPEGLASIQPAAGQNDGGPRPAQPYRPAGSAPPQSAQSTVQGRSSATTAAGITAPPDAISKSPAATPSPPTQLASIVRPGDGSQQTSPTIGLMVRAIPRDQGSPPVEIQQYSQQLSELLERQVRELSGVTLTTKTEVLAAKQLRKLQREDDAHAISKSVCEQMQLDALFVAVVEPIHVSDSYGFSYWREPEFVFYDCRRDQRVREVFRVEEKGQDRFPFEIELKRRFRDFAEPYVSVLQPGP